MKILLLSLILATSTVAFAQVPDAPHPPKFDRTDWAILAADAGSRALDTYSTRWMLKQGDHELFLLGFVANHTQVLAGVEGGMVAVDYFAARYLVRHHHPKLAKVALIADFTQNAPWSIHNLFLRPGKR